MTNFGDLDLVLDIKDVIQKDHSLLDLAIMTKVVFGRPTNPKARLSVFRNS